MEERLIECLRIALQYNVTDIHFNLYADESLVIEMRVSGVIRQLKPHGEDAHFFRYLLYRANLDISNTLLPQTGSFEAVVDGRRLALRFALISSYQMNSGVLRILNNHARINTGMLSSDQRQTQWLQKITQHRNGLVVFSGPTGSGKTTTLYTLLSETSGKKIYTLEDPVEVYSEQYVQLQINEKQNMGYAEGIKQLMRHDPDIIMIGEIRDAVAAKMAVRCALTGHLVLTSLHSASCVNAIGRLLELEVPPTQLRDVLTGVANQRLYDYADGKGKIGVYEIMDAKEVAYYFTHGKTSEEFRGLQQQIGAAVRQGTVAAAQVLPDLDEASRL